MARARPFRISEQSERGRAAGSGLRKNTPERSATIRRPPPAEARLSRETLVALAPAANHLLRAVSEVVAAAQAAFEALPVETRDRSRWSIRSARAALDLVARLALSGAERARRQARETLKAETAREIIAALDARSSRLDGRAADALRTVRAAVADSLGAAPSESASAASAGVPRGAAAPSESASAGVPRGAAATPPPPVRRRNAGRPRTARLRRIPRIPPVSFGAEDEEDE